MKTSLSCCRCMALTHHGYCGPTPSLRDGRSPRSFVHASNPSSSALAAASPLVNPRTFRRCFRWLLRSRARVWAGGGLYRREAPSPNRAQAASHPPRNDDARDGTSRPVASRAYHERPTVHLFEGIVPLLEPRLGGAGRPGDGCSAWPSQWEWRNIFGSPSHVGTPFDLAAIAQNFASHPSRMEHPRSVCKRVSESTRWCSRLSPCLL